MDEKTKRTIDFQTRKSVHINLTRGAHGEYRKTLLDYSLSMQEVFELFASLVGEKDKRATSIVEQAYKNKRDRITEPFNKTETRNLYDAISEIDSF